MSVGNQPNKSSTDMQLSQIAVQLRNIMTQIRNLDTEVNGQGTGLAFLESIGYSSAPNAANPDDMSDAQYAQALIEQMFVIAQLYYGTVTIPVTVAATAPVSPNVGDYWVDTAGGAQLKQWNGSTWAVYSPDNSLSVLWNGQ